ncbi:Myosin-like IQ motif-containing domain [Phytophthora cinnamomi]|uniref:Myosin-like IQ motif-containing domain n=1 Tax=Phytophthora cinnamomi TaxID=4785 RepID=UPI003559AAF5|nr:Myosin-like IQ motif-containing domain [Phytophthora cinnamomi]
MLALNSYGLAPRTSTSNNNNNASACERVTLPRLCGAGLPAAREIRSLGKLDILARTPGHPLYRTTTGYDYGRYMDFQDVALSCPKHARPAGFTKEFIAGSYADSSLLSLENSRRRAESWQQKMALRTSRMRVKYAELQHVLEEKRELRRVERDRRRREMELLRSAIVRLQARLRGYLARRTMSQEKLKRDTEAALCIQQASRARARVRVAKQVLEARRREKQEVFVIKIQRVCRSFLQRKRAKRQLMRLREAKRQKAIDLEHEALRQRSGAAKQIQRLARGHLARKDLHRQASNASSMASDKDDKDALLSINGRIRSRGARRVIAQMQQVRRKHTKAVARIAALPPK